MKEVAATEADAWRKVTDMFADRQVLLGQRTSSGIFNEPGRLAFLLARYKFAGRIATRGKRVLELGCGEGYGGRLLAEFAQQYIGIDRDPEALAIARRNLAWEKCRLVEGHFLGCRLGPVDTVVGFDLLDDVAPEREDDFFATCWHNLAEDGIGVFGVANANVAAICCPAGRPRTARFDGARLQAAVRRYFHNVFLFTQSDEVVHTGFAPTAQYLLAVGVYKRKDVGP